MTKPPRLRFPPAFLDDDTRPVIIRKLDAQINHAQNELNESGKIKIKKDSLRCPSYQPSWAVV
jgi:hypothetical protein